MRICNQVSYEVSVLSGSIQGSVLGPDMFSVVLDSLLMQLNFLSFGFADDIKCLVDLVTYTDAHVQTDLNKVDAWSLEHHMPLSIDKSAVLHCGMRNPQYRYHLQGDLLKSTDTVSDLGILRASSRGYDQHFAEVSTKASKLSGAIIRAFHGSPASISMLAFNTYVLLILMYASPIWNPSFVRNKTILENAQRRFTKRLTGYRNKSYDQRLHDLKVMSL